LSFVVLPEAPNPGEALPEVINNPDVEKAWAIKAFQHAEIYYKLITSVKDHNKLKLTQIDDEIYALFRSTFPDLKVDFLKEEELKNEEGKKKWAPFMMGFEKKLEMFNFLTLLRIDAKGSYSEDNTIVVPRIQWLCLELARLREGVNKYVIKQ
jgi:hypothetical protein